MQNKWKELHARQRAAAVISIAIGALVIVLSGLQIFEIWNKAINVSLPLLGVLFLCQAYLQWKTSRKTAYAYIGTAILIFAGSIVIFLK